MQARPVNHCPNIEFSATPPFDGATHAVDARTDSVDGLDVEAFIDASRAPQAVRSGIKAVGPAGPVILVRLGADDVELPVSYIQNREIWLSGVFRYANTWPLAIQWLPMGRLTSTFS